MVQLNEIKPIKYFFELCKGKSILHVVEMEVNMSFSKKIIILLVIIALCLASASCGFTKKVEVFAYSPGDYFVTNITDSKSLLKSDLTIEMTGKSQYDELGKNTFKVRDIIINVLRNKTYEELKNPDIQDILKVEISNKINESLGIDTIQNIYFNEFVIQ